MPSADNKRVAKNALALTLRMVLVTIVGLFTSRIVLEALGVDDYGIYGVIGGVVAMASFLNASMAGATSRFITFELGRGNKNKLKIVFSTALIIHIIIAIVVAILAETVGLWFVNNKMNFPSGSMFAVNVLYQFTILSMFVSFTQVPYSAAIIAHEKMNIYAYFEIINTILKLVIVYVLLLFQKDRLILYAGLQFGVTVLNALFYRWYCSRKFDEAHISLKFNKTIAKEMLIFSGFDVYGNMCSIVKSQGEPIIINIFFGVVANAAASISLTVSNIINALTMNISHAFRPQIIKQYSIGDMSKVNVTMQRSLQFTLLAYSLFAIPVLIETHRIIYIWLGQVPQYTVSFLRLVIILALTTIIIGHNNTLIHATGNIKRLSFICGTMYLLCPVISYTILKYFNGVASCIYITDIILMSIVILIGFWIIYNQVLNFDIRKYIITIIKTMFVIGLAVVSVYYLKIIVMPYLMILSLDNIVLSILILAANTMAVFLSIALYSYCFAFSKNERHALLIQIRKLLRINTK